MGDSSKKAKAKVNNSNAAAVSPEMARLQRLMLKSKQARPGTSRMQRHQIEGRKRKKEGMEQQQANNKRRQGAYSFCQSECRRWLTKMPLSHVVQAKMTEYKSKAQAAKAKLPKVSPHEKQQVDRLQWQAHSMCPELRWHRHIGRK